MDSVLYEQFFRLEDRHWWFLGRRELVLQELRRFAPNPPGPLLDLGCGTGGMLVHLQRLAPAVGLDTAPEAAETCRKRGVPFVMGWGSTLPFRDGSFGMVTALDVIEHIPEEHGVLLEMRRVLRPGGVLLVTVPAYQFLWSRHDELNHHKRRYSRRELGAVLTRAGFTIEKLSYYNTLLFPAAVARKAVMRFRTQDGPASHLDDVPGPINAVLRRILLGEQPLLRRWDLPFGASLICVARRSDDAPAQQAPAVREAVAATG
jgi:ubiquinone/menaquinone biosynthesis C-methylase UbiE